MMESFFEGLFDRSAVMRALRKSAKKATQLGIADALGCSGDGTNLEMDQMSEETAEQKTGKTQPPNAVHGIPLPRPQLLGIAAAKSSDEPDQPGVPPKRIRQKRRGQDDGGGADVPPEAVPEANDEKGDGK
jgi:hypothetical protein